MRNSDFPSVYFEFVDRGVLATDIKKHVTNPDYVNQASTNLCGIAAITQLFIEFEPKDYVEAVWELYFTGKATLYSYQIFASPILGKSPPSLGLSAADYIFLSSMRLTENSVFGYNPPSDEGEGMTFPWEIKPIIESLTRLRDVTTQVLNRAGWRANPADRTILNYMALFDELNKFIAGDAKVIVLYDSGILGGSPGVLGSNYSIYWHYIQYRKGWTDHNETIYLDYWDYGNLVVTQKVVSLDLFQKSLKQIWVFH